MSDTLTSQLPPEQMTLRRWARRREFLTIMLCSHLRRGDLACVTNTGTCHLFYRCAVGQRECDGRRYGQTVIFLVFALLNGNMKCHYSCLIPTVLFLI